MTSAGRMASGSLAELVRDCRVVGVTNTGLANLPLHDFAQNRI
jgi:hypothetical protein